MPGRAKCEPGCTCERHNRPRLSEEEVREHARAAARRTYAKHREATLERQRQARVGPAGDDLRRRAREREANRTPEEKARKAQLNKDWYAAHPKDSEEHSRAHYWTRYRITPADRQRLIDEQDGLCYLCGDPLLLDEPRKVHVDHDHDHCSGNTACGKCIRGVACDPCNRGIGYFRSDPERLRRVADNLEMANRRLRSSPSAQRGRANLGGIETPPGE